MKEGLIIVRGGGDLATGTIHRLWSAGFSVLVLEAEHPAAIRRQVSLSEAIYDGETVVEDMKGIRIEELHQAFPVIEAGNVPVFRDPEGRAIRVLRPAIVIDAILAKKNLGTTREMAPFTIALGPGFTAGRDVDIVIETKRGHDLGRIIRTGCAIENTGIPGNVGGYTIERVNHAPAAGIFHGIRKIGDLVEAGEEIAWIENEEGSHVPVTAKISGVLRGLLRENHRVCKGFKIADVDPRVEEKKHCFTISDKARCIAGSALEVTVRYFRTGAY